MNGRALISILIASSSSCSSRTPLSSSVVPPLNFLSLVLLCPPFPLIQLETIAAFLSRSVSLPAPVSLFPFVFLVPSILSLSVSERRRQLSFLFLTEHSNCSSFSVAAD